MCGMAWLLSTGQMSSRNVMVSLLLRVCRISEVVSLLLVSLLLMMMCVGLMLSLLVRVTS